MQAWYLRFLQDLPTPHRSVHGNWDNYSYAYLRGLQSVALTFQRLSGIAKKTSSETREAFAAFRPFSAFQFVTAQVRRSVGDPVRSLVLPRPRTVLMQELFSAFRMVQLRHATLVAVPVPGNLGMNFEFAPIRIVAASGLEHLHLIPPPALPQLVELVHSVVDAQRVVGVRPQESVIPDPPLILVIPVAFRDGERVADLAPSGPLGILPLPPVSLGTVPSAVHAPASLTRRSLPLVRGLEVQHDLGVRMDPSVVSVLLSRRVE